MISFGMIDLKISIFITGLDCCNNYSQKAFPNSCRCKYFKRNFILVGTSISKPKLVFNIYSKENFIFHIFSQNFQNNSNIKMIWLDRSSQQNVYYFGPYLAKIHPRGTVKFTVWISHTSHEFWPWLLSHATHFSKKWKEIAIL